MQPDKIALEEHFILPEFIPYLDQALPNVSPQAHDELVGAMLDFGEARLAAMDSAGVRMAVLSLSGPGVQAETDTAKAASLVRQRQPVWHNSPMTGWRPKSPGNQTDTQDLRIFRC